jgi:CAAX protease family protein
VSLSTEGPPPPRQPGAPIVALPVLFLAAWSLLVSASPRAFFAVAPIFCVAWIASSVLGAPAGLRDRLRPSGADVAIGLGAGLLLYAATRLFLWGACGGLTDALCRPMVEMYVRFRTQAVWPALALGVLVAPAEELFWRGVVQAHLARRLRPAAAVALATALAVTVALVAGEPFLALATLPTYAAWGALAALRGSLVPAIVSHAVWSVLVASVAPPV